MESGNDFANMTLIERSPHPKDINKNSEALLQNINTVKEGDSGPQGLAKKINK